MMPGPARLLRGAASATDAGLILDHPTSRPTCHQSEHLTGMVSDVVLA